MMVTDPKVVEFTTRVVRTIFASRQLRDGQPRVVIVAAAVALFRDLEQEHEKKEST